MGQKVNPILFRLKMTSSWLSSWYSDDRTYSTKLHQDLEIRTFLHKKFVHAGLSKVVIERIAKKVIIILHTSRPGVIIGKKGVDISKLKSDLASIVSSEIIINIVEVKKAELEPSLVSKSIAEQLEKRASFRKVLKRAISSTMKMGAKGVRITVKGRLGGTEIARTEWYKEGRIPLHTLRSKISYATAQAHTIYGVIGIKVWIYRGDQINKESKNLIKNEFTSKKNEV
jgi:small subunit ribosomal protein S3